MGLFKKGNPVTEKQIAVLEMVVNGQGSREGTEVDWPKDIVKECKKILKKPKKYTSKDVSPLVYRIFDMS